MGAKSGDVSQLTINTLRTLAMDAVQAADSGHPGTPMALAPVGYTLFARALQFDPGAPLWPARDRFVLSCGHASMLLYGLLHLAGVEQVDDAGHTLGELAVPLDHMRRFRQWGSRCPGHPERGHTSGVETTTGPLGQGAGNSVGMAIAREWLAARYDRPGCELFDYRVYALCSDGDLMEGVCCEAASLAGHLKLGRLCWIYDDNRITIDGTTDLSFSEDVAGRFEAYGWQVLRVPDANDVAMIERALMRFRETDDRPTLIMVQSVIGYGAPRKQGTPDAHGAPLGAEEVRAAKRAYGWPEEAEFLVPEEAARHLHGALVERSRPLREAWQRARRTYARKYPELAAELELIERGGLPADWDREWPTFAADVKGVASRVSGGKAINALAARVPWLVQGAADLAGSTRTTLAGGGDFGPGQRSGRNLHFGVREHAMGSILNGMALSGLRVAGSTFFVFADYLRPALRLSALMGLPVTYVFTHDSIAVGEDGPTHQPIEQLASLRAIPNVTVIRPADAAETVEAWRVIARHHGGPVVLVLSRQNLPSLDRVEVGTAADGKLHSAEGLAQGGYVLVDAPEGPAEVALLASGSEVSLCVQAWKLLNENGIATRVVSLPSWELFERQSAEYRATVLPAELLVRVGVEAGVEQGWSRYLGRHGAFVGLDGFGASAPASEMLKRKGLTAEAIVVAVERALSDCG